MGIVVVLCILQQNSYDTNMLYYIIQHTAVACSFFSWTRWPRLLSTLECTFSWLKTWFGNRMSAPSPVSNSGGNCIHIIKKIMQYAKRKEFFATVVLVSDTRPSKNYKCSLLHFACIVDDTKCIVVTCEAASVCLTVCSRMPTQWLLHGPGCNLGEW